jgi:Domain of unknown function (DUF5753)
MPKRSSTARGRELGAGLRAAIKRADLTSRAAAEILNWDEAKLSDVINGKGGTSLVEVALLLGVCRVEATEVTHLLSLYPETHVQGWWQPHGMCSPVHLRTIAQNLALAGALVCWHSHMVPLFLQTADYLREVVQACSTTPADELMDRVRAQLAMQELLRRRVNCTFFIHEFALLLQVGGPKVHAEQMQYLMLMANLSHVTIRVVPAARGAHAGLAGPFTHLTFEKYESLVWVETENSTLIAEAKDSIKGYEKVTQALERTSLSEAESLAFIARLSLA